MTERSNWMKQIKNVQVEEIGFHEGLQKELSTYLEKKQFKKIDLFQLIE